MVVIDKCTGKKYGGYCADAKVRYTFKFEKYKKLSEEKAVIEIVPFIFYDNKVQGYLYNITK